MDAILELPAGLPPHDDAPLRAVRHQVVAEWPRGTFLENLVCLPDGGVVVSVLSEARLDLVALDGERRCLRQFDAPTTGVALVDGFVFVAVGEPGAGTPTLWRVDPATGEGEAWMPLDGVVFANGVTPFAPRELLVADSWLGRLVRVELDARRCSTWVEDERLARAPGIDLLPGANGVKRYGREVTVSSNGRALLLRATVDGEGRVGDLRVVAERLRVDDLAYDREGSLYLATHIGHSLDRLDRDGARVTLAGPDEGMAGSTACAFAPDGGLYVTTTGGILAPPGGLLQPARLVRVQVDAAGWPLDRAWEG